jgi:Uma2 family endonuclease
MAAPPLMTTQQYLMTEETLRPQELIFGVFRMSDAPKPRHQQLVAELFVPMALHVRQERLGTMWLSPLDVVLDDENGLVVQPDMFFIGGDRLPFVPDRIRLAPDLMVEVLSPSTTTRLGTDPEERLGWFARYGVRECWLVHQFQFRTEVVRFENGGIAARESYGFDVPLRSSVLPDFRPVLYEVLDSSLGTRDS